LRVGGGAGGAGGNNAGGDFDPHQNAELERKMREQDEAMK